MAFTIDDLADIKQDHIGKVTAKYQHVTAEYFVNDLSKKNSRVRDGQRLDEKEAEAVARDVVRLLLVAYLKDSLGIDLTKTDEKVIDQFAEDNLGINVQALTQQFKQRPITAASMAEIGGSIADTIVQKKQKGLITRLSTALFSGDGDNLRAAFRDYLQKSTGKSVDEAAMRNITPQDILRLYSVIDAQNAGLDATLGKYLKKP